MGEGPAAGGGGEASESDAPQSLDSLGGGFLEALRRALGVAAADAAPASPPGAEKAPPDIPQSSR